MLSYENNENLIRKVAWNLCNTTPDNIEFDDLFSEGNIAYCMAVQKWDGSKGCKFSTYLYTVVKNRLLNYIKSITNYNKNYEYNDQEQGPLKNSELDAFGADIDKMLIIKEDVLQNDYLKLAFSIAEKTNRIKAGVTEVMRMDGKTWPEIQKNIAQFDIYLKEWEEL